MIPDSIYGGLATIRSHDRPICRRKQVSLVQDWLIDQPVGADQVLPGIVQRRPDPDRSGQSRTRQPCFSQPGGQADADAARAGAGIENPQRMSRSGAGIWPAAQAVSTRTSLSGRGTSTPGPTMKSQTAKVHAPGQSKPAAPGAARRPAVARIWSACTVSTTMFRMGV